MSEEIIDLKDVMERVQGDRELLCELFDIYQEDFIKKRQALGEAITGRTVAAKLGAGKSNVPTLGSTEPDDC